MCPPPWPMPPIPPPPIPPGPRMPRPPPPQGLDPDLDIANGSSLKDSFNCHAPESCTPSAGLVLKPLQPAAASKTSTTLAIIEQLMPQRTFDRIRRSPQSSEEQSARDHWLEL